MPKYKLLLYLRVGIGDTKQRFPFADILALHEDYRISFNVIENGSLCFARQFILIHFERKSLLVFQDEFLPLVLRAYFGEFFPVHNHVSVFVDDHSHVFAFETAILGGVLIWLVEG